LGLDILFIGTPGGTLQHRIYALGRLGHHVHVIDPERFVPRSRILAKLHFESGGLLYEKRIRDHILREVAGLRFDLTWVDPGRYVGPQLVRQLRSHGPVINYVEDDPFGKRDRYVWLLVRRTTPEYDMMVVRRQPNVEEGYRAGAKKMVLLFLTCDEIAHAPRVLTPEDHARWDSEVAFVGTWFPERGPFMKELLERGVPLSIYGNRWQKAPEWPVLQRAWKGPATRNDHEYAAAIQCARVCLGLLSKGNRDLHTRRSIEVPALGGLLCAERTVEHEHLYRDGEEAVFWNDAAECATVCKQLLADEAKRRQIARQGHLRNLENGHFNEPVLAKILAEALCR
jgi:hypothetical protein